MSVMMLMTTLSSKIVLTRYSLHWIYFSVNKGPRYCKPNDDDNDDDDFDDDDNDNDDDDDDDGTLQPCQQHSNSNGD